MSDLGRFVLDPDKLEVELRAFKLNPGILEVDDKVEGPAVLTSETVEEFEGLKPKLKQIKI